MRRAFATACLAAACAGGCTPRQPATEAPPPPPQVMLHGVRMQMFRGGELVMVGRAARLAYQRDSADMTATEGLLRFPSRQTGIRAPGKAVSGLEIRAPVVEGNLASRQTVARGGVVLRTSSGLVAQTPSATLDGQTMKVRGDEPVVVHGPGYGLTAQGFTLDFDQEDFVFTGGTQTELGPGLGWRAAPSRPAGKGPGR